ncbi:trehalase-like isoform X2 [Culicoides brevitarsis]|uniref:trehalase-like isoform X2 n=1 Tax=Culicoides brevitarsis TaxID=469753 RepID=UPI00307BB68E
MRLSPRMIQTLASEIFCHGKLLHTVQMAGIYNDSKTFVDMKLHASPKETLEKFNTFMQSTNEAPTKPEIKKWVEENFDQPGSEFEDWIPDDWKREPQFLERIKDHALREWASDLNHLWLKLGRKMTKDVQDHNELYSIIHVENPVIVPGGRFREFYYWDSYWIIRGLLLSEMHHTAKGMLLNFRSIVQRYGFIPNGGRIYYSARSQPPLLAAMIKTYVEATGDTEFAKESVDDLEHEFNFWLNNHAVVVNGYTLAVYGDKSTGPRPESYREDVETGHDLPDDAAKEEYYSELKAGAESGMDFSSRWFIKDGTNKGTLRDLKTRSIVPVDLNAILYENALIISEFYALSGDVNKARNYKEKADELLTAINKVLWHDDVGMWLDYDMLNDKRRDYFCASNLWPLWSKAYNKADEPKIVQKVLAYIEKNGLDEYPGGVPNTFEQTGEQWDFPNVWPPLQYVVVMGMNNLNDPEAKQMAYNWALRWVRSNFIAYRDTRAMYEKYSAVELGGHGGGGEYEIQLGFGWSNGVVMDFLAKWGDKMTASDHQENSAMSVVVASPATQSILATLMAFLSTNLSRVFQNIKRALGLE